MSRQQADESDAYLHGVQIWKWRAMTKHSNAKTQKEKDEIFEWIQQEARRRTENRTGATFETGSLQEGQKEGRRAQSTEPNRIRVAQRRVDRAEQPPWKKGPIRRRRQIYGTERTV